MNDNPSPSQSDQNLPVPVHQTTAIARPAGGGRNLPSQLQTGEPEAVPWGQYVDAIRRRWWVVAIVFVLGSVGGKLYSRRIPAEYEATTKIFQSPVNRVDPTGPIVAPQVLTPVTLEEMVKQPFIVAPVVRDLVLNVHYKWADWASFKNFGYDSVFTPGQYRLQIDSLGRTYVLTLGPKTEAPETEVGQVGDSIGRKFGLRWLPEPSSLKPKQLIEFGLNDIMGEALNLVGNLRTGQAQQGGQILTLTLTSTDRDRVAPTLNAWADEFIRYATEAKRTQLIERRRVIEEQLRQALGSQAAAEADLTRFRENNAFVVIDPQSAGSVANQQLQLEQIRRDLQTIQRVLDSAGDGSIDKGPLYGSSAIMAGSPQLSIALGNLMTAEADLATAKAQYADGSPNVVLAQSRVRALTDTLIPAILGDIKRNFVVLDSTLTGQVTARSEELRQIPKITMDGLRKQKAYEQAATLANTLSLSAQQIRLVDEQTTPDLSVMGRATPPPWSSSSRGPRIFIIAVGASLAAGLALALLLDRLDRRFRYPQQATMELGLTIAGTIPFFKPNRKGELNLAASAQVVESFRTLRLATQFHFPPVEPVVVCISSPGPGEGKSLVASNLAVAFANAGQKTLLIDGDVRRGVVHTTFEAERRPGLVDYLGGTATSMQIIRQTSTDHLSIVPSGSRSRRAPELLTSDRMASLVAEMRSKFEVIIIDSAPFVAGMDAFALGAAAGTMLIVLRPGITDRKLAENKLEILDRLPVTIIGAVLNAISAGRAYRYYSDYATYEGEEDMDEADFDEGQPPPTSPTRLIKNR